MEELMKEFKIQKCHMILGIPGIINDYFSQLLFFIQIHNTCNSTNIYYGSKYWIKVIAFIQKFIEVYFNAFSTNYFLNDYHIMFNILKSMLIQPMSIMNLNMF